MSDSLAIKMASPLAVQHEETCCFHCGLPVPQGAHYPIVFDNISHPSCCRGCQAVAQVILESDHGDYYRHRTELPQPAVGADEQAPDWLQTIRLFDLPEIQSTFVRQEPGDAREASLILEGIVCAACVWLNERHIAALPGVLQADVNYSTRRARVRWDDSRIHLSDILKAIRDIGYSAHPFDSSRQEAVYQKERKTALRRLFIAGFGMMQVMMYAVPMYLADDGTMSADIAGLMRWSSLLLTLPVVFYSAWPFFVGAMRDLKRRRAGMDVPVALGVGSAFIASVWATVSGGGQVYFDSVSMFVFFLLTGRFLEMIAQRKAGEAAESLVKLIPAVATFLPNYPSYEGEARVPLSRLKRGDHVLIRPGESIPADGSVVDGESGVDESLLTGESRTVAKGLNAPLVGGAINLASPLVMQVERLGQDTVLSGIVRLLDRAQSEKPRMARIADRVAGWFVTGLLLIAAGVGLAWYSLDAQRALWITISVLVVSCPCALSLATPVALAAATGRLTRLGLLITRGHALETLSKATHVVFDKTGTLTEGKMQVLEVLVADEGKRDEYVALAAVLEQGSEHPVGRAVRSLAPASGVTRASNMTDIKGVPGSGMEGIINGVRYRLGSPHFVAALHGLEMPWKEALTHSDTLVALGNDHGWLALFVLGDGLREDASALIRGLQDMGLEVSLLSGDRREVVAKVADTLGIKHWDAELEPAGKLAKLKEFQQHGARLVMVGDGVNDAPVLAAADVSVAMGSGTEVAQASADMVLLSTRLLHLLDGVKAARLTDRVIRQNLAWAVMYNLVAIPAAALGYVTPWMAGIGMSASSLLVVLNALRLTGKPGRSANNTFTKPRES